MTVFATVFNVVVYGGLFLLGTLLMALPLVRARYSEMAGEPVADVDRKVWVVSGLGLCGLLLEAMR